MPRSSIALRLLALTVTLAAAACSRTESPTGRGAPAHAPNTVIVDGQGFHPASISAPAGRPLRLTFRRTSDDGCGQQVVFPSLRLQRDLPLNTDVTVDVTAPAQGSLAFTCGMGMLRGAVVVQ